MSRTKDYSLEGTYWNHTGAQQALAVKLRELLPDEGEVDNADDNPALETFRVASNCYYDLYNNGLCNRAIEFREVFEFGPKEEDDRDLSINDCPNDCCREDPFDAGADYYDSLDDAEVQKIEARMTEIILAAAKEQGVTPTKKKSAARKRKNS